MPQVVYLLFFVLSSTNSVSCSILFARTGENVSVPCQCSRVRGCYDELTRWVRMDSDESLKIINTKCEKSPCRFTSKRTDDATVALTIVQVESEDSGRYYCGEHLSSYVQFTDNGNVLKIGDVWTNGSAVHLLNERMGEGGSLDWSNAQTINSGQESMSEWMNRTDANSESDNSDFPGVQHTELRCVVTRLSAPYVNVRWRSSQVSSAKEGQTWYVTDTERGYRVESRLRIGVKAQSEWEDEDKYRHPMNLDWMVQMDEELWCEVEVGVDLFFHSQKFSFHQQTNTNSVISEWCNQLLYGEIGLCVLCMSLLSLLTCHWLHHQHKGSEPSAADVPPTFDSYRDVSSSNITYAQLEIKKQPRTERRQRQKTGEKIRQEDKLVYSEVRYKHQA